MKRFLFAAALVAVSAPVLATDVGVSISIGQPGFYGQIDIGDGYPPPRILYREPRVVQRVAMHRPPVYLHVPPGHARHWKKHCREYNACGERVYFVSNNWYQNQYVPHYQEQHRAKRGGDHGDHGDRGNNKHHGKQGKDHGNKNGH